jgi:hypothetical protein
MQPIDGKQRWRDYVAEHPHIARIVSEDIYGAMQDSYEQLAADRIGQWRANIAGNMEGKLTRRMLVNNDMHSIAVDKAVVAIGAGPSLNNNWNMLLALCDEESRKPWAEKDFVTVVCNHQAKRLLNLGVRPDFVVVMDTDAYTTDQLDVGDKAKGICLVASIAVRPETAQAWRGGVRFLVPDGDIADAFEERAERTFDSRMYIPTGGNCINTIWSLVLGLWKAKAWMCVGNDLGYPPTKDLDAKRFNFYADANYATHKRQDRDEVVASLETPGFIWTPGGLTYCVYETTPPLWGYKVWLELNAELMKGHSELLTYNCSEGGILGVQREGDVCTLYDNANPQWRTRRLEDAIAEFRGWKYARN